MSYNHSGKSTLLTTLLRAVPNTTGTISIDGVSTSNLPLSLLRRRLITIPQDYVHIPGPLRLGVDHWGLSSDAQIDQALRTVHLDHLLANDHHHGNGHDDGDGGKRLAPLDRELDLAALSHGQRQLLAAARAALQRSAQRTAVLLLDEAVGALDPAAEAAVTGALLGTGARSDGDGGSQGLGRCTVVCVSHRPETILAADVVVVMEAGEVVEMGPPKQLILTEGGWLRTLLRG
jgi:ABC-type multidrug transport system fused ATPase/permease subunit